MSVEITLINKQNQETYTHLNGFVSSESLTKASKALLAILEKIKINSKDLKIQINGTSNGSSFFDNEVQFTSYLAKLTDENINNIAEINIDVKDITEDNLEFNWDTIPQKYKVLRNEIIKHIKNSKEEVFFETNDDEEKNKQQPVNVGNPPANDNEVDSLEKEYIKRNDDLHQVKVCYKKANKNKQTRHIVFGKEVVQTNEETAKNMVDLYRQDNDKEKDEEKRLIAKDTAKILDSVDYQKDAGTGKITGANVCYSQATTDAIADILKNNSNNDKADFIKATLKLRTAIYILIPDTDQYAKYQLVPENGILVFEMEKNYFTREGGKFKKSNNKVENQDKNKLPKVDSFTIYRTNQEQQQGLWDCKQPSTYFNPQKVEVKQEQQMAK